MRSTCEAGGLTAAGGAADELPDFSDEGLSNCSWFRLTFGPHLGLGECDAEFFFRVSYSSCVETSTPPTFRLIKLSRSEINSGSSVAKAPVPHPTLSNEIRSPLDRLSRVVITAFLKYFISAIRGALGHWVCVIEAGGGRPSTPPANWSDIQPRLTTGQRLSDRSFPKQPESFRIR